MIENLPPRPSRGDPRLAPLLRELQGNILRGHGRPHAAFVLLRFTAPARAARRWVSAFGGWVETAAVQYAGGNAYLAPGAAPFHALYLSAAGYRHLQIDPALWPADPAFRAGMAAAGPRLGDPPPSDWQPGLAPGVQAVLLVAHAERAALDVALARIVASLGGVAEWRVEHGHANQRQQRGGLLPSYRFVEHFGFADGRSQPLFFAEDLADDAEDEPGGDAVFDPAAPLSQVLVPDAIGGPGAFGSYVVWRKLEQDVRGLHRTLRSLAASHPAARGDAARAGALMVGRWPDGTPLPLADAPGLGERNGFGFGADAAGARCPFSAHVRRLNPRDGGDAQAQRIVRRGISYGPPPRPFAELAAEPLEALPEGGVGLQFVCFQASIGAQFEALQQRLNTVADGDGPDPIGSTAAGGALQWQGGAAGFERFVRLLGGEYLYAPPRAALLQFVSLPLA